MSEVYTQENKDERSEVEKLKAIIATGINNTNEVAENEDEVTKAIRKAIKGN